MVSLPGRSGRRRRVLNEEVLSASSSHVALRAATDGLAGNSSRYGVLASLENHPQITDFIPRRQRTIAFMLVGGMAASGLAIAGHQLATQFVARLSGTEAGAFDVIDQSGLVAWLSAVLFLLTGITSSIVHSIRRHRIDDVRGRYRLWRWTGIACVVASANSVAGFHNLIADGMSHLAGWTALRGGACWWLGLAAIPFSWLALRTFLDVKESRFAAALWFLTMTSYAVATVSFLGFLPAEVTQWEPLVTCSASIVGSWLLFASVVTYARHVVLDAQGLVAEKPAKSITKPKIKVHEADDSDEDDSTSASQKSESTRTTSTARLHVHNPEPTREKSPPQIVPARSQANTKDWVDGRRRERDRYQSEDDDDAEEENDGDRKLSKSDRKQQRKLKARSRAA